MDEHPRITEIGRLLARIADLEAEVERLREQVKYYPGVVDENLLLLEENMRLRGEKI
jgi:regulator of replication initiation timing